MDPPPQLRRRLEPKVTAVDAPTVLFIPGMMLDERVYAAQLAALKHVGQRYVADITRSNSIETLARDVLASAPPRFALVGLSLGGIVALEICRQASARVTHLALLDTTPHADRPERASLRLEQIAAVRRGELEHVLKISMKPLYLATCHQGNTGLLARILEMGLSLGPEVFLRQSVALRSRADSRYLLPAIACPTLVLCGREDRLCSVDVHFEMANALPRADLMVLAGAGHLPTMEQPAAVSAALEYLIGRSC